ncbi:cell division protein FtsQ/DivIB [Planococcus salinus]|uniref:Cell division protein DivIB n=1 Tax=Planococcus salinus TaxID=1848460 RepID=A0A3M8PAG9_9BACL|nr:FtsQ-type POTRA domain-containing protein [Planococcus salinus]RNF40677.1 FtsQ-type POTRA domain-containing protein [Planococcus salinus]
MNKVIDIEERIPTLRERRRKRTNRKFAALLLIFLILLAVLLYSQSKYSKIQNISINGAALFEPEYYQKASGLETEDSMWSFTEKSIEQQLASLEWVKEVSVTKEWLTDVELVIEEHEPIGYLDLGNTYQLVLENGFAMEKAVSVIDGPIFSNFENEKMREQLVLQLADTSPEVYNLISQVILEQGDRETAFVTVYMNDGNEVKAILSTLAEKLAYYPSVIAQLPKGQKGVVDMEVGIFFRSYEDMYGPPREVNVEDESAAE